MAVGAVAPVAAAAAAVELCRDADYSIQKEFVGRLTYENGRW